MDVKGWLKGYGTVRQCHPSSQRTCILASTPTLGSRQWDAKASHRGLIFAQGSALVCRHPELIAMKEIKRQWNRDTVRPEPRRAAAIDPAYQRFCWECGTHRQCRGLRSLCGKVRPRSSAKGSRRSGGLLSIASPHKYPHLYIYKKGY